MVNLGNNIYSAHNGYLLTSEVPSVQNNREQEIKLKLHIQVKKKTITIHLQLRLWQSD